MNRLTDGQSPLNRRRKRNLGRSRGRATEQETGAESRGCTTGSQVDKKDSGQRKEQFYEGKRQGQHELLRTQYGRRILAWGEEAKGKAGSLLGRVSVLNGGLGAGT